METPDWNERQAPTDSTLALQAVIGHSPMAIVAIDLDRNVILWNPGAERMFGWTESEVIGRPYPAVPDADQEAYRKQVDAEHAAQSFSDLEVQRRGKDGSMFPARLSVAPLKDESGMIIGSVSILADITDQKQAEQALRESEARLSKAAEMAGIGYWVWDEVEDRAIYCSDGLAKMYGVASGDELAAMLSSHAADLEWVHPDDRERFDQAARTYEETKGGFHIEYRIFNAVGETRHVLVIEEPVLDERGKIIRSNGTAQDITERKRAENELRESEARFRTLVEHAPEAITMLDVDTGLYLDANPMAEALHGLPRDELIGKLGPADLSPEIQLDGRPSSEAALDYLSRALAGEFPRFEWMHLAPDGQETPCEVSLARLPDPHRNLVRASISDITERKRAEEALQQSRSELIKAQEIAKVGSWTWHLDDQGKINVSDEYLRIIGFPADQPPKNQAEFNRYVHPDDLVRTVKIFDEAVNLPSDFEVEYRFVRPDGEIRHIVELGELVYDNSGRAIGHAGTIQDMTELKRAEEQLLQAQKMEAVGQLTGGVAHDFNNLLGIILGNAELLKEKHEDDDTRDLLGRVIRATQRGAELTFRLLAFSRQQPLNPQAIDIGELCKGITDLLRRTLGETVEIDLQIGELSPARADPGQLESALLNLALNARDAMAGGGTLTIEARNVTLTGADMDLHRDGQSGDYVVLKVSDSGTGMAPDVVKHAFEPFFTTKEIGAGSGLGLSMVCGFAQQSGGHMTIESEEGHGTTVALYLPQAEAAGEDAQPEAAGDVSPRGQGETILVVEDEPALRRITVRQLEGLGYQTLQAPDGPVALEVLANSPEIDLLLSDMVLPGGMNGPEIYQQVREQHPDLRCLFMSGYASTPEGTLPDGVDLLSKPFGIAKLAQKLQSTLVA